MRAPNGVMHSAEGEAISAETQVLMFQRKRHKPMLGIVFLCCFTRIALCDDVSNSIDAFDQAVSPERFGTEIVNADTRAPSANVTDHASPRVKRRPYKTTAIQIPRKSDVLAYYSDRAVSDSVRRYMFDISRKNNPSFARIADRSFGSDASLTRFDRMFAPYGYTGQNVGDALAGALILLWEVANNADAFRYEAGIRSIRESVRRAVEQNGKAVTLSNAEKQRNAEILKYGSIFFVDTIEQLQEGGDYEDLRECRDQAARTARRFGVNLYRTSFTDHGFVSR
jgi:hypothetical protein